MINQSQQSQSGIQEVRTLYHHYSNTAIPAHARILKLKVSKANLSETENVITLQRRRLDVKKGLRKEKRHDVLASETTEEV